MADLRDVALQALRTWRKDESGDGVPSEEFDRILALVDDIAPTTRLIIEAGNLLGLTGLRSGAEAAPAALAAMLRVLGGDSAFQAALSAASECRVDTPYASIRVVIKADGTRQWCCTHASGPHCSS
jgi:hypothetical protein